jgi:hypothetical protein
LQRLLVVGVIVASVHRLLMLGLALTGLFLRPRIAGLLEWATRIAFWLSALAIGISLTHGIALMAGLVLGVAAFGSQCVVGYVLTAGLPREDRVDLALGHQNGITAVILALLLEPTVTGTVAAVAPAIVVVNLLHGASNAIWAKKRRRPSPVLAQSSADAPVEAAA